MRPKNDFKGCNKSTKGKGLLHTLPEPLLPSSISMAPHLNTSLQNKNKDNNSDTTKTSRELQWEMIPMTRSG